MELRLAGKVLEDSMNGAIAECPILIRVVVGVTVHDRRRAARHEQVVQQNDPSSRRKRRVEPEHKLALSLNRDMGEPESPLQGRMEVFFPV